MRTIKQLFLHSFLIVLISNALPVYNVCNGTKNISLHIAQPLSHACSWENSSSKTTLWVYNTLDFLLCVLVVLVCGHTFNKL